VSIATLLPERMGRASTSTAYGNPPFDSVLIDVVRRVFVGSDGVGCQAIALLYPRPEVSASLLCASLASILGDLHGKVLVMSARELLGLAASKSEVNDSNFLRVGDSSIWLTPGATAGADAKVDLRDVDKVMATLRRQFDFLLIDAGAFSDLSKSAEIAKHVDGFLVLVRERQTAVRDLVSVRHGLEKTGGRIIGSIYSGYGLTMAGGR